MKVRLRCLIVGYGLVPKERSQDTVKAAARSNNQLFFGSESYLAGLVRHWPADLGLDPGFPPFGAAASHSSAVGDTIPNRDAFTAV
jgi:hypothetical protein